MNWWRRCGMHIYVYIYICTHTVEYYYSPIKNEDILLFAVTWVNLEDTMVSEINQIVKKPLLIYLTYMWNWPLSSQKTLIENRLIVARSRGVESGGNGCRRSKGTSFQLQNKCHGDIMYNMVNIVNNTVVYIWKLLRVYLKSSHHKKTNYYVWWGMLS